MKDEAPGEEGGRRRLSARVPLLTALPLLCAEAASPAGRRHRPRRRGGWGAKPGEPARRTLTCHGAQTQQSSRPPPLPDGTGAAGRGERGVRGAGYGIRKTTVLQIARFSYPPPPTLRAPSFATSNPPSESNGRVRVTASAGSLV